MYINNCSKNKYFLWCWCAITNRTLFLMSGNNHTKDFLQNVDAIMMIQYFLQYLTEKG